MIYGVYSVACEDFLWMTQSLELAQELCMDAALESGYNLFTAFCMASDLPLEECLKQSVARMAEISIIEYKITI